MQTKQFFKSISNSNTFLSFLLIWNWNDKYAHTLQQFFEKPYPIPDQNGQSVYPFSNQNGAKTLPDGAAQTYIAYTREYHRPPPRPDTEGSRDGLASPAEFYKPAGLCVEFDHVLYISDAQTNCIKVLTTLH